MPDREYHRSHCPLAPSSKHPLHRLLSCDHHHQDPSKQSLRQRWGRSSRAAVGDPWRRIGRSCARRLMSDHSHVRPLYRLDCQACGKSRIWSHRCHRSHSIACLGELVRAGHSGGGLLVDWSCYPSGWLTEAEGETVSAMVGWWKGCCEIRSC